MAEGPGSLPPSQETWIQSLVPGFTLACPWLIHGFWEVTQWMEFLVCLFLSLRLSNKLQNSLLKKKYSGFFSPTTAFQYVKVYL